ncbi:MAG: hypothetical protein KKF41_09370 [Actinobacteria bacterium]|nr:hypothetical protein [Actinomycetota bacterium]MBU1945210.1 hypothetical protein [Actinomycetota bacterium]MBU2687782.1 hypothetical protein [Actinomycetota bacterium]
MGGEKKEGILHQPVGELLKKDLSIPEVLKKELSVPEVLKKEIPLPEFLTRDITFSDLLGREKSPPRKPAHVALHCSSMVDEVECPRCGVMTPSNLDRCVGCGADLDENPDAAVEKSFYGEHKALADYNW